MRRRDFITLVGGATAAWPLATKAQQSQRVRCIGVLMPGTENDPVASNWVGSFRDALAKLGWVDGGNLRIDYRWAGNDASKMPGYAAELVGLMPDAIFATANQSVAALQQATRTVPIVFANVADPIGLGFVSSVAHPGGNITGFALYRGSISAERLELLKQIAPSVARVAFIYDPSNPVWSAFLAEIEAAAPSFGVSVSDVPVHDLVEIEAAINACGREPNGSLIVLPGQAVANHRDNIIALAARNRLPAVYSYRYFVLEGGLVSYGVDFDQQLRDAASYVDRILKGAKPGDLPVQFADKFELVINMKTARALGLTVPPSLLALADELIE